MWEADEVSKGLAALPATASWRRRSLGGGRAGASRLGRRAVLAWIPCLDKLSSFLTAAAKVQPIGPARRTEEFQKARCLCGRLGLVASNLNLKPGECLKVRGEVAPDAKSFVLNLGKDSNNLCLHFNPRFDMHGDINTIVCNSKDGGAWGAEQRESAFPFQPGSVVEVCISFGQTDLTIKLPDGYEFSFPNRLNLEAIEYLAADGDFKIKCVAFE
uniref:Galectin n=1 Tax=Sus scrofa TaxID=9823 RepID=A0A5G2Q797_PIG